MFQHVQTCLRITWIVTIHIILNLNKLRHVWTCSDMFENHMNHNNSYHTYWIWTRSDMFQHVQTCLRITWIITIHIILNLNKFRHVSTCSDMFGNHMNCNNSYIKSEQVQTCFENHMNCNNSDLENLKNLDNWVLWTFWELTCR
jgi:hypothetical protein